MFDFPDPNLSSERRIDTTLPQQSLFLMNSPFMIARAKALAALGGDAAGIYRFALGRAPGPEEAAIAAAFLKVPGREAALAQALLASNEFLFVD